MSYITASEIARHVFCARALAYDRQHLSTLDPSWWVAVRRVLLSPWRMGVVIISILLVTLFTDIGVALVSLVLGVLLLGLARLLWNRLGWSSGLVVYHGTQARRNRQTFASPSFSLVGKPDYLLATEDGGYIPILTKKTPAPDQPHQAQIVQIIAHCLVVAEQKNYHPPYGVIRYQDGRTFEIDFDEDSIEVLSRYMDEIEANRQRDDVPRSHSSRRRCSACSQRKRCDQSLF